MAFSPRASMISTVIAPMFVW